MYFLYFLYFFVTRRAAAAATAAAAAEEFPAPSSPRSPDVQGVAKPFGQTPHSDLLPAANKSRVPKLGSYQCA